MANDQDRSDQLARKADHIYADEHDVVAPFQFDARVADVFADMIKRSVPGYLSLLEDSARIIGSHFSRQRYQEPPVIVDLGCSLGAAMQVIAARLDPFPLNCLGIDNSTAMLDQAATLWVDRDQVTTCWIEANLETYQPIPADVILMNFTLQFLPLESRDALLARIYKALKPGGLCLISEKIAFQAQEHQILITDAYHQFKSDQGYSDLEISQKRQALDNVLVPETVEAHEARFAQAGFAKISRWSQRMSFASWVMTKSVPDYDATTSNFAD